LSEKLVAVICGPIPAELKTAVVAEAEERGISASDAAVEKLAQEFRVKFTPRELTKTTPDHGSNETQLFLYMPPALRRKIKGRAASRDTTATAVMRDAMLDAYKLLAA